MALYYFIADVHLGLLYKDTAEREKEFASFLYSLPDKTKEIYLLGDIFDFWYEYKEVIPRGFTRTLGALAYLSDRGVKVHFFNGNHDIWTYNYLQKELGLIIEKQPAVVELEGKRFCLGHGDGLWDNSMGYRVLQGVFKCRFLQFLFSGLHPRWAFLLGHIWSKHNRLTREEFKAQDSDSEPNIQVAAKIQKWRTKTVAASIEWAENFAKGKKIDYFIFGHQHLVENEPLTRGARLFFLGDWIHNPGYVVFDGASCKWNAIS